MAKYQNTVKRIVKYLCFFFPEAGSRFWQGGSFEVRKSVEGEQGETEGEAGTTRISSLEVTVPSELEGVAYIQVEVKTVPGECRWLYAKRFNVFLSSHSANPSPVMHLFVVCVC